MLGSNSLAVSLSRLAGGRSEASRQVPQRLMAGAIVARNTAPLRVR